MDDFMMYKYLQEMKDSRGEDKFIEKFRQYMSNKRNSMGRYKRDSDNFWAIMPSKERDHWDFYMKRNSNYPHDNYYDNMDEDDFYKMSKMMRNSMHSMDNIDEETAKQIVSEMYHMEKGRKHIGEKYSMTRAKEICERYSSIIPSNIKTPDIYVAINAQYHDYAELFKTWFGDSIDQKIIESAIVFWFKDNDFEHQNKVIDYFKL